MDRVDAWLHREADRLVLDRRRAPRGALEVLLDGAHAGLTALVAAGALDEERATRWRSRFDEAAASGVAVPQGPEVDALRPAATSLLRERLDAVLAGVRRPEDVDLRRHGEFMAAVHLMGDLGLVEDTAAWLAEEQRALGLAVPGDLDEDGPVERDGEVRAVVPGPARWSEGYRVLVAVVFDAWTLVALDARGGTVSAFSVDRRWRLDDGHGSRLDPGGGSGGGRWVLLQFDGRIADEAETLTLSRGEHAIAAVRLR